MFPSTSEIWYILLVSNLLHPIWTKGEGKVVVWKQLELREWTDMKPIVQMMSNAHSLFVILSLLLNFGSSRASISPRNRRCLGPLIVRGSSTGIPLPPASKGCSQRRIEEMMAMRIDSNELLSWVNSTYCDRDPGFLRRINILTCERKY